MKNYNMERKKEMEKKASKGRIIINPDYCKACELCIVVCPKKRISLGIKINKMGYHAAVPDPDKECIACKSCAIMCPEGAIDIYKEK